MPASGAALCSPRGASKPAFARILLALVALAFLANAAPASSMPASSGNGGPGPANAPAAFELKWGEGGVVDTPIIRCDEASWRFLGLSFAGWNAVVSAFSLAGGRRLRRERKRR